MSIAQRVGSRIKSIRQQRNMTQTNLGDASGVSVSFISMIERAERTAHLDTLVKIADSLDVDVADLFAGGEDPKASTPARQQVVDFVNKRALTAGQVKKLLVVANELFA